MMNVCLTDIFLAFDEMRHSLGAFGGDRVDDLIKKNPDNKDANKGDIENIQIQGQPELIEAKIISNCDESEFGAYFEEVFEISDGISFFGRGSAQSEQEILSVDIDFEYDGEIIEDERSFEESAEQGESHEHDEYLVEMVYGDVYVV